MSSLVSTGPRRGAVMTEHTFHAMADSQQPPSFAVSDIYHALNDESAGLAFLKDAEVSDVICYHSEGSGSHYYLMLNVRLPQQTGAHNVVCARAERVPGTQERAFFGIVRRAPAACDNIKFSYSAPVIRGPGDDLIMMLRCNSVRLIQAVYLFGIIHTHSQEYHATSLNSSWFAAVSVGVLRHLDGNSDWTSSPNREWIRAAVGSSTKEVTRKVTREALSFWDVHEVVDLSNEAVWGPYREPTSQTEPLHEPASPQSTLSQPLLTLSPTTSLSPKGSGNTSPPLSNNHVYPTVRGVNGTSVTGPAITDVSRSVSSAFGSPRSTGSYPSNGSINLPRDLAFPELVRRVVATDDIDNYKVLIVGHESVTPPRELLRVVKKMVRGLTGDGRAQLEDRVLKFLHTWVSIGFLDTSLHPEVLQYVNRPPFSHRDDVIQIQAALAEPTPLPATEHQSETTTPSVSSVGLTASSNQQRIERTIGEMESADLPGLARALFEMETDNWKDLTMFRAVKSLTAWRDDPDAWDSKPFSPLAGKIHDWVNEECLDANPEVRQKAFCALYLLACECERMRNFASSQAIARGLSGRFLRRFNHIRDRAASEAGGPEKLSAALQRLFSKPPKDIQVAIPPLDSRLRALLPAFRAIRDDGGTVDWDACKEFHRSLNLELGQPLPASQEPRAPEFCHQFFRERMHAAESSRTRHRHLSEDLSAAEARGRA